MPGRRRKALKSEAQLILLAKELASREFRQLNSASVDLVNLQAVAECFKLNFQREVLLTGRDGAYIEEKRLIVVDSRVSNTERVRYTFFHELMHHLIRQEPTFLSDVHDAAPGIEFDQFLERLCQAGASEFIIPTSIVLEYLRHYEFTSLAIPNLAEEHKVSGPAVAFQLTHCAKHECYLAVCGPAPRMPNIAPPLLTDCDINGVTEVAIVTKYTAKSYAAKYQLRLGVMVAKDHIIAEAYRERSHRVGDGRIPFASQTNMIVPCDANYYRGSVYAFFHVTSPISPKQLELF